MTYEKKMGIESGVRTLCVLENVPSTVTTTRSGVSTGQEAARTVEQR